MGLIIEGGQQNCFIPLSRKNEFWRVIQDDGTSVVAVPDVNNNSSLLYRARLREVSFQNHTGDDIVLAPHCQIIQRLQPGDSYALRLPSLDTDRRVGIVLFRQTKE